MASQKALDLTLLAAWARPCSSDQASTPRALLFADIQTEMQSSSSFLIRAVQVRACTRMCDLSPERAGALLLRQPEADLGRRRLGAEHHEAGARVEGDAHRLSARCEDRLRTARPRAEYDIGVTVMGTPWL
eukprot:6181144-Pleurochrysis_carterae.AAC.5